MAIDPNSASVLRFVLGVASAGVFLILDGVPAVPVLVQQVGSTFTHCWNCETLVKSTVWLLLLYLLSLYVKPLMINYQQIEKVRAYWSRWLSGAP